MCGGGGGAEQLSVGHASTPSGLLRLGGGWEISPVFDTQVRLQGWNLRETDRQTDRQTQTETQRD